MEKRAMSRVKILELMAKFKALEMQTRLVHEIFFAMNLNNFKKCQKKGGD